MTIYCRESGHVLADEIEAALEKSVAWLVSIRIKIIAFEVYDEHVS